MIIGEGNIYSYYVYSNSIARYNDENQELEIKKHDTDQWTKVNEPAVWRRVQEEGDQVSQQEAEAMYKIFHANVLKNSERND